MLQPRNAEYDVHNTSSLKKMGYSSRQRHQGPLASAKNRKVKLLFTQADQQWTAEVMVKGDSLLIPIEHHCVASAFLSIVAILVHPFISTFDHFLMAISSRIKHSHHLKMVSGTWQGVPCSPRASTDTRSKSSRTPLGGDALDFLHHRCAAKSAATAWCHHVDMGQNLMFLKSKNATENQSILVWVCALPWFQCGSSFIWCILCLLFYHFCASTYTVEN